jgi:hypothetical protein
MKHFSGNYWWSKSEYIRTIPDIRNDDWWKGGFLALVRVPYC